jgi:hypothetical protein
MSKDDFYCTLLLIGLFLVFCLAPDLYIPTFTNR